MSGEAPIALVPIGRVAGGRAGPDDDDRRPRGDPAWPRVGVFARRAKNRPNRLGMGCCLRSGYW
jgi:hypothetical protein